MTRVIMYCVLLVSFTVAVAYSVKAKAQRQACTSSSVGYIQKQCDEETGIVCFYIKKEVCVGDCAYSPAISCFKY
jgi:hypothetical protein